MITHIHSKIHTEISYCHSFLLLSERVVWYLGIMGLLPSTKSFLILYLHFNNSQQKPQWRKLSIFLLANKRNFPHLYFISTYITKKGLFSWCSTPQHKYCMTSFPGMWPKEKRKERSSVVQDLYQRNIFYFSWFLLF